MLWTGTVKSPDGIVRTFPVGGKTELEAMEATDRLAPVAPLFRGVAVEPLVLDSWDAQDAAFEALNSAWGDYCDYAEESRFVCNDEFNDGVDAYHSSWAAVNDGFEG